MAFRFGVFLSALLIFGGWEFLRPSRLSPDRFRRWPLNFSFALVGAFLSRLILVLLALDQRPGKLNGILTLLIFDCAIYWQHRLFHRWNFFWRFHQIHHLDSFIDISSAVRFHPVEIFFSTLLKASLIVLLNVQWHWYLIFEGVLSSMAIFNHANIDLPAKWDKLLRRIVVTPSMHRVHHSTETNEQHRNFGFNLAIWDYLFGSFCGQAKEGANFSVGIKGAIENQSWNLYQRPFHGS